MPLIPAGKVVVDRSDVRIAVGMAGPAKGLGGTGNVVQYAIQQHRRTMHINPTNHCVAEL